MLLTRAAVETAAALWYLSTKIKAALKAEEIGDIDQYLMSLSLGSKAENREGLPKAINVITFVNYVEKEVEGFRRHYDELSEYAHPNYLGTTGLYSRRHVENTTVSYGENPRASNAARTIGVINLSVALMMFEHTYNSLEKLMPDFVTLCEKSLPS
jgi:hypothetical protein